MNFNTVTEYVSYLENPLIPDLRESGKDATADDFQEAIDWISKLREENGTLRMENLALIHSLSSINTVISQTLEEIRK